MKTLPSRLSPALTAAFAFTSLLLVAGTAQAAAFVRFEGIDGESADRNHRDWCDITSFSRGITTPAGATGATRRRGAAQFGDLTIVRRVDRASPKLEEALTTGQVVPTVTIDVTASYGGGGRMTYYQIVLTNVRITSYSQRLDGASEGPIVEEIGLGFERMAVTYSQIDAAGRQVGNVSYQATVADNR